MNESLPFTDREFEQAPDSIKQFLVSTVQQHQQTMGQNQTLINRIKAKYFPESNFVGPYEKASIVHGVITEQWLWKYRHFVSGSVMDMSTPVYWNMFLRQLPSVTDWTITDLDQDTVTKLGYASPVGIKGDWCENPAPVSEPTFDTILAISIHEHAENPIALTVNLAKALKSGGKLLIALPYAYIDGHHRPDYWRIGRDGLMLMGKKANLSVLEIGEFVDLGKYFLLEFGWSAEANGSHFGIPFNNWVIYQKD